MEPKTKRILIFAVILLIIGGIIVFVGTLFKLQHWEGGGTLLTLGMVIEVLSGFLFLLAIMRYFFRKDKQDNEVMSR